MADPYFQESRGSLQARSKVLTIESLNAVFSIVTLVVTPLVTWIVMVTTHGVKMERIEKEIDDIKNKADAQVLQYQEILSRLSRIEGKLEKRN